MFGHGGWDSLQTGFVFTVYLLQFSAVVMFSYCGFATFSPNPEDLPFSRSPGVSASSDKGVEETLPEEDDVTEDISSPSSSTPQIAAATAFEPSANPIVGLAIPPASLAEGLAIDRDEVVQSEDSRPMGGSRGAGAGLGEGLDVPRVSDRSIARASGEDLDVDDLGVGEVGGLEYLLRWFSVVGQAVGLPLPLDMM